MKKDMLRNQSEEYDVEWLKEKVLDISRVAWDKRIEKTKLDEWLKNFNGKALNDSKKEKYIALWIMLHFTFYTEKEVRYLNRCLFDEYLHKKLLEYELDRIFVDKTIVQKISHIAESSIFLPLGCLSESGAFIVYYFRQVNKLPVSMFDIKLDNQYENIVYIDDVTVSGNQAYKNIKAYNNIKKLNNIEGFNKANTKEYLLTMIATDDSIEYFEDKLKNINLIYVEKIDQRSKVFSDTSFAFSSEQSLKMKEDAKIMCKKYGSLLDNDPYGFENGQYLFGFFYNVPNNTLPILWGNKNNWMPAFERYPKRRKRIDTRDIDDERYF